MNELLAVSRREERCYGDKGAEDDIKSLGRGSVRADIVFSGELLMHTVFVLGVPVISGDGGGSGGGPLVVDIGLVFEKREVAWPYIESIYKKN